ncbi:MAG TPA: hypothetical protein VKA54_15140 [Gemmatimonadaceae bacterium]|nr:hypothetical protein [Gemmatimonadaceae bacterium]
MGAEISRQAVEHSLDAQELIARDFAIVIRAEPEVGRELELERQLAGRSEPYVEMIQ